MKTERIKDKDAKEAATDLMAQMLGWAQLKRMKGVISQRDAIAYGERAVNLLMAARTSW